MNNIFTHRIYELEYLIPYSRQLSTDEAARIVTHVISREKQALLERWKSIPKNKDWSGDEEKKKEELFRHAHRLNAPVVVFGESIDNILKGVSP